MKVAIIGLPQTGKTTVFNSITGAHGDVGGFHAGGAALAVVRVPDARLDRLVEMFQPKKVRHATLEFEDLAGIFAHMGGPSEAGAQAVARAREADMLLVVLRSFPDPTVPHVLESVDPARDAARISEELLLADLSVVENRIENICSDMARALPAAEREELQHELELLENCREAVEQQRGIRSVKMTAPQEKLLRSYAFLTLKPVLDVLNMGEEQIAEPPDLARLLPRGAPPVLMCGRLEMEMMDLEEEDRALFMEDAGLSELAAGRVVRRCCEALGVRTFFTYAHEEVGAWMARAGDNAVEAARKIHSDMARGFIRAEVVGFDDLQACGSIKEAKAHGKVRLEGKDYEVRDGDVITFRFSGA